MKKIVRIIAALMLLASFVSLVGCGGTELGNRGSGKVTLKFTHMWPEHAQIMKQLCQEYSAKNPNVVIQPAYVQYDQMENTLKSSLVSGGLPDVFIFWSNAFSSFAKGGHLANIDEYVLAEKDNYVNDGFALEDGKFDGHYYAAPFRASGFCVVYNKNIFEKNGWQVPKTLEELDALCAQITKESPLTPLAVYGTSSGTMMMVKSTFDAYVDIISGLATDPTYINGRQDIRELPEVQELYAKALVKYKSWYDSGYFTKAPTTKDNARKEFTNNNTAMILFNNNNLGDLIKEINGAFEVGIISFPAPQVVVDSNGAMKNFTSGSFDSLFISKDTKNYEEAMKFVEYMMSDEVQQRWAKETTSVSLKKAVTYDSEEQIRVAEILSQIGSYPQKKDYTLTSAMSTRNYQMILNYLNGSSSDTAMDIIAEAQENARICVEDAGLALMPVGKELDLAEEKYEWLN